MKAAADTFYASLNEKEIETLNLSEKLILQMYTEYALAERYMPVLFRTSIPKSAMMKPVW